jgi:Fe-S-cluster-containing dehydrogenase component
MARYGIVCDIDKCTGCYSCFLACKDEHLGNDHLPISVSQSEGQKWINVKEIEQGTGSKVKVDYLPVMCQHCEDAPCMRLAPKGAVYKREDGIIVIDPEKAVGCKEIVDTCPYGCVEWNESLKLPQKCTMCAHMLDRGEKTTRCVEVCPTGALVFGDLDDPESEISRVIANNQGKLETFMPQYGVETTVKYLNLPKIFVCGELVFSDTGECAEGVKVILTCNQSGTAVETRTDFLGDFEFKGLEKFAEYTLKIEAEGYKTEEISIRTNASKNLKEIYLQKV